MQDTRIAPYEQQKPRKIKPYELRHTIMRPTRWGLFIIPITSVGWKRQGWIS